MESNRIGDSGLSDSGPSNHHQLVPYAALPGIHTHTTSIKQEASAFECGELEEATLLKLQGLKIRNDEAKARLFLGSGSGAAAGNIISGAAIFDKEYARWLEDDQWHLSQLRAALNTNLPDTNLRMIVNGGTWKTIAKRCFLWIGGFRPSQLIKILIRQLDPLTERQLMAILSLQQASEQEEEAISQGMEQPLQSLMETIVNDASQQMAAALHKLDCLQSFAHQADSLRKRIIHSFPQILTVGQTARCYLLIGEFDGRLRALSSLWTNSSVDTKLSL